MGHVLCKEPVPVLRSKPRPIDPVRLPDGHSKLERSSRRYGTAFYVTFLPFLCVRLLVVEVEYCTQASGFPCGLGNSSGSSKSVLNYHARFVAVRAASDPVNEPGSVSGASVGTEQGNAPDSAAYPLETWPIRLALGVHQRAALDVVSRFSGRLLVSSEFQASK